jgi:hypothetical protein
MPYLVCENCGGYYELKEGEYPNDFENKCQCGSDLRYIESIEEDNLQMEDTSQFEDNQQLEDDSQIEEHPQTDLSSDSTFDIGDETDEKENKTHFSRNLFRISAVLAFLVIIIVSASIITHQSGSYGVFSPNENEKYSTEEISTFMESAFSPDDYGNSYDKVGKWHINVVRIKVMGQPTDEDMKTLNKAINDINTNVKDFQLKIDDVNKMEPDMEIYFIPHSQFAQFSVNPSEVDGFTMWMVSTSGIYGGNSAGEIYKARVIIGTDQKSQKRRSHVIIHELEHSLGLHHNQNKNSALCKFGPDYTEYTDLDKTMIRILYRKDILPNMSRSQVETILNNSKSSFF